MKIEDVVPLITNVGFPVTLCFILIHYVLDTIGEKLEKLDTSLHLLTQAIQSLAEQEKTGNIKMVRK
ncbi:hypothetical protein [Paenibacillus sp. FSL H8-0332]|uniref:hypothetical protein n=1 Tax=Paenibacillus sp. FSL H8-0332 TaxID=2954742 RepID=UPI0030CEAA50